MNTKKKYGILRLIGAIYKILGVILAVLTLLSALGFCVTGVLGGTAMEQFSRDFQRPGNPMMPTGAGLLGGVIAGLGILLSGGAAALGFYAIGEGIYLLISLEENTRATVELLKKQDDNPPPSEG